MCNFIEKKYKNPPLIEAIFELKPSKPVELDFIALSSFYEKLKSDFKIREKAKHEDIELSYSDKGLQHIRKTSNVLRMLKEDKATVVQLADSFFTVHKLKPYGSWDDFKPIIQNVFSIYQEIVNPNQEFNLTLRYINKIDFKQTTVKTEEYLNYYIHTPNSFPDLMDFSANSTSQCKPNEILSLETSLLPQGSEEQFISILLSLQYSILKLGNIENLDASLENAHISILKTFESLITDKTRELFEVEK